MEFTVKLFLKKSMLLVLLCVTCAFGRELPQEKEYANSIGMKFVRIEPGEFRMGRLNSPLAAEVVKGKSFLWDGDELPVK